MGGGCSPCPLNNCNQIITREYVLGRGGGICGIELVYVDCGDASCGLAYAVILMIVAVGTGCNFHPCACHSVPVIPVIQVRSILRKIAVIVVITVADPKSVL